MIDERPLVSVVMGVYNGERTIRRAIDSILCQTYSNIELVICDDNSQDETYKILMEYRAKDGRIVILRNEENRKLAHSLNKCISKSKGIYIARMDDDDVAKPNRIQTEVDFLNNNPLVSVVSSCANIFDENGVYGQRGFPGNITPLGLLKGHSHIHPSVMIRKQDLISVGGYTDTKDTQRTEDLDLWYKMLKNGFQGFVLEHVLMDYYESLSSMKKRKYCYRINEYKVRKKIYKDFNIGRLAYIYVVKPLLVGLLPNWLLKKLKYKRR